MLFVMHLPVNVQWQIAVAVMIAGFASLGRLETVDIWHIPAEKHHSGSWLDSGVRESARIQ